MDGTNASVPASPERKYAAIFIDAPNVAHKRIGTAVEQIPFRRIDWARLIREMFLTLEEGKYDSPRSSVYGYASNGSQAGKALWNALEAALGKDLSYVDVLVSEKDIDANMAIDIYDWIVGTVIEHLTERANTPCDITVLVASGDHIFASVVRRARARFKNISVNIKLHTFAWRSSFSLDLMRESSKIWHLDTMHLIGTNTVSVSN